MTFKLKVYSLYCISFLIFIFGLIEIYGIFIESINDNLESFILSLKVLTFFIGLIDILQFIFSSIFFYTSDMRLYNSIVDIINTNLYFNISVALLFLRILFNFILYLIVFFLITSYHNDYIELGTINKNIQITSIINYIFGCIVSFLTIIVIGYTCYQTCNNKQNRYKLIVNNNRIEVVDQKKTGEPKNNDTDDELEKLLVDNRYQDV